MHRFTKTTVDVHFVGNADAPVKALELPWDEFDADGDGPATGAGSSSDLWARSHADLCADRQRLTECTRAYILVVSLTQGLKGGSWVGR